MSSFFTCLTSSMSSIFLREMEMWTGTGVPEHNVGKGSYVLRLYEFSFKGRILPFLRRRGQNFFVGEKLKARVKLSCR